MDVSVICSELVKINSENPPGNTRDLVEYISDFFDKLGIKYKITDNDGHCSIYTDDKDRLCFMGHIDTVGTNAAYWDKDPHSGEIDDEYVYGRGSTDMKGGCAAVLAAAEKTVDEGKTLPCGFAFVCDEETGSKFGTRYLLAKKLIAPSEVLIAEPTPKLCPGVGQKGIARFVSHFTGQPAHGSRYPDCGVSAIASAGDFMSIFPPLHEYEFSGGESTDSLIENSIKAIASLTDVPPEKLLKRLNYNLGIISGGDAVNIVPQNCSLTYEFRIPIGCTREWLVSRLKSETENRGGRLEITGYEEPTFTPSDSLIVKTLCSEIEKELHTPAVPFIQWAASDARHLRNCGIDAVEYGPGLLEYLHADNEKIRRDSLSEAQHIYEGVINAYISRM